MGSHKKPQANAPILPMLSLQTPTGPRAIDNQVFVACINRVGVEGEPHYCGNSLVAGPDGEVLGHLGDEVGFSVIDIVLSLVNEGRTHQDYLKDLRSLPGVNI